MKRLIRPAESQQLAMRLAALDALPLVVFLARADGWIEYWNAQFYEVTGTAPATGLGDAWLQSVAPEQRAGVREHFYGGVTGGEAFSSEARIRCANGAFRWMRLSCRPLDAPAAGAVVEWLGTLTDIDRQHHIDEARGMFASLAEASDDFISIATLAGEIVFVNQAGRKLLGIGTLDDARETQLIDYFVPEDRPYVHEVVFPALERSGRWTQDFRFRHFRTGESVDVLYNLFYIRDPKTSDPVAIATVSTDIRERTLSERRLRTLVDAGATLAHSLDYAATLASLAELLVRTVATYCVIDVFPGTPDDATIERIAAVHADRERRAAMAAFFDFAPSFEHLTDPVVQAFIVGSSSLVGQVDDAWIERSATSPEHALALRALGVRSLVTVPLVAQGEVLGALTCGLGDESSGMSRPQSYDAEDLFFIEELGRRGGAAVENARLYERERRIAVSLQEASLPRTLPRFDRLCLAAYYRPGKTEATIGGDWYDAFALEDGRVVLTIGDVLGNGLAAAITMTKLRQAMQAAAMVEADPNRMLDVADKTLRLHDRDAYATAIAAIYDARTNTTIFASAGHPGPILRTPSGEVQELSSSGLLLGLRTGKDRPFSVIATPPESTLVFYTDGLTETTRNVEEGQARLSEAVAELDVTRESAARTVVDVVLRGEDASDDIAVLIATVAPLVQPPAAGMQTTYSDSPRSLPSEAHHN